MSASSSTRTLLIATRNSGKMREFASLFAELQTDLVSLRDVPELPDVEETGTTFVENALLKAKTISELTGLPVLADDSGLCVRELNGEPGVYSARYGGEHGNDERNNRKLLSELAKARASNPERFTVLASTGDAELLAQASFVCVLVYHQPGQEPIVVQGECRGFIIEQPRGNGGFGYDPHFYIAELGKTMAELTVEEKNRVSHRSQALRKLRDQLS